MGSHPKPNERREARLLRRRHGMPVKQIAARIGVSVSSVSLWVRDIQLGESQRQRNLRRASALRGAGWRETCRAKRAAYQEEGRTGAREGNPLHEAGCMLYWAEGAKDRNALELANSDVHLVRFFCRFLRNSFDVGAADFRIRLNVYTNNGLTIDEIEDH